MAEAPLNKVDKARIKWLMKTEQWESILRFFAYKTAKWNEGEINGSNEFETLKALHTRQGKVDGLAEFMNQLEHQALDE